MAVKRENRGNFVSEWYGHRIYPTASKENAALEAWRTGECPFLSRVTDEHRQCIKNENSQGVCTINTLTESGRRDWLVCPYRALDPRLLDETVRRLFQIDPQTNTVVLPAIRFDSNEEREALLGALHDGARCFLYFDQKLGGEISLSKTPSSPEFSIDVTLLEISIYDGAPSIRKFGALEIQTMDFHGSYKHASKNLVDAIRLHGDGFASNVDKNQTWASDRIEGPNLANVFKRTFYQMAFKFQLGRSHACAGCVLALPKAVWESWRPHLGDPVLMRDRHSSLNVEGIANPNPPIAWIISFDLEATRTGGPDRIHFDEIIETSAAALTHWALEVAPANALAAASADSGIAGTIQRRLSLFWPELANRVLLESGVETS
jgi:hypothetical protein